MSNLLLDSLLIENFRAFKRLEVEKLGRVNLIVGKNNVGKTALLEALWLYAAQGAEHVLAELVRRRDEVAFVSAQQRPEQELDWREALSNLHHGRPAFTALPQFSPLRNERLLFSVGSASNWGNVMQFTVLDVDARSSYGRKLGLRARYVDSIEERWDVDDSSSQLSDTLQEALGKSPRENQMLPYYFIPSSGLSLAELGFAWKKVVLAGRKDVAREALRRIDASVRDVDFVSVSNGIGSGSDGDAQPGFIPICQREGEPTPVPLRSMGEGMDRLLGLSLALVMADGGLLMVDEIESGLHYSVQPDMWRLVLETAERLNVQVFATTHSLDCIRAFQAVAEEHPEEGVLISLRRKRDTPDEIVAVTLDEGELETAVSGHIEVR